MDLVEQLKNGGTSFQDESHLETLRATFLSNLVESEENVDLERLSGEERINFVRNKFQWTRVPSIFYERFEKSDFKSQLLRQAGNDYAKCGFVKKALHAYSLALAFAPPKSESVYLAYGNRSVLLSQFKNRRKDALQDIQRALAYEKYPSSGKNALEARKKKLENFSEDFIESERPVDVEWVEKLFKIKNSNSDLHSAADFVGCSIDELHGRKLIVTQQVQPGTPLLLESAFVRVLEPNLTWSFSFCHTCFRHIHVGIPCETCSFAWYCNETCASHSNSSEHQMYEKLFPYLFAIRTNEKDLLAILAVLKLRQKDKQILKSLEERKNGAPVTNVPFVDAFNLISHGDKCPIQERMTNVFRALIYIHLIQERTSFFSDMDSQDECFMLLSLAK